MTATETLYLVVDIAQDLLDSSDDTYYLLLAIADGDEPAQEIDGILVTEHDAALRLQDYVTAWEAAWLRTAKSMGHDAIAAGGGSPQAHEHLRRNSLAALDYSDTGISTVDMAWEKVWDACPHVTLAEAAKA